MKTIKFLFAALILALNFTSCSKSDDDEQNVDINPLEDYNMLSSISANGHDIQIYSE